MEHAISLIVNQKSLQILYSEAKEGNDKSLCRLIQIDKTIFDHEWMRTRIRKAMYHGDRIFFKALGKAIATDPLQNRKYKIDVLIILLFFWPLGLYRLTVPQLMHLLEDGGLNIGRENDEVTFRKYIDRIKPFTKAWNTSINKTTKSENMS